MGSDAFLAWSEHWPEVLKVDSFSDKYCDKSSARERKLTHVLTKGLSRLARKKGLEEPRYGGYDFPLKSVPWSYTTTLETIGTDIDTVDWEKSGSSGSCVLVGDDKNVDMGSNRGNRIPLEKAES
ncbi:MAG: hypothetical protein J5861_03720, partial [Desulfovibrio sp.]|nr:hypothetical protein [Desulfovibrio sp.]